MKRLQKMIRKTKKIKTDNREVNDVKAFYEMLLKFEKRHSQFNAKSVFIKLYPNIDINTLL